MIRNCLLLLLISGMGIVQAQAQTRTKKVVFIIVDGIPADVIEKVSTPHLDKIARTGGYTRAYMGGEKGGYSETPTISAVGYNSLLTGTWVHKHQVTDNDIKNPNYHYRTIFRFLEEQYPEKKTAIFSTWLDNRTRLIGEGLPETGHIQLDYHFDGFELDTLAFPHDAERKFIFNIDEHVTAEASRYLRSQAPDLSWVYLEYTDDMGHRHGDSDIFYDAVRKADRQVGQIWEAVQYRQQHYAEDWLIIITTDHGRDQQSGRHHGGQSERERTIWITTNAENLNEYFRKEQPGIVDIMPTIARFMKLDIPQHQLMEIDGIPLTGPVSLTGMAVRQQGDSLHIRWKALEKQGKVKVWLATTNHFKTSGQREQYRLVGEVSLQQQQYTIRLSGMSSDFYKIVLEAPHNYANRWHIPGAARQKYK